MTTCKLTGLQTQRQTCFLFRLRRRHPGRPHCTGRGRWGDPSSQPRQVFPKDLAGELKRLDNGEFDALLSRPSAQTKKPRCIPESARCLALGGAEILVNPTNWGAPDQYLYHVPTRAVENRCWVIGATKPRRSAQFGEKLKTASWLCVVGAVSRWGSSSDLSGREVTSYSTRENRLGTPKFKRKKVLLATTFLSAALILNVTISGMVPAKRRQSCRFPLIVGIFSEAPQH
jgi:hypothetical protein